MNAPSVGLNLLPRSPSSMALNNVVYEQKNQTHAAQHKPSYEKLHDPALLLQAIADTQLQAILEPNTLVIFKDLLQRTIELVGCTCNTL